MKKNGIEIEELMPGRARVRLRMPFGAAYSVKELSPAVLSAMASLAPAKRRSLENTEIEDADFAQVNPADTDYIYPQFRALSATLIADYFLDFSSEGVLKEAVPLLFGQTVYTNHRFWDVERWCGVVNLSEWDATGTNTDGVPGINVELKIDWKVRPILARGLLMKPPAIHSVSATVMFEWDASHPDLLEKGIFWQSLGEEIEGEIVRLIVTKILGFWELSLVFQGADGYAKQLPGESDDAPEELSAGGRVRSFEKPKQALKKETKVKLTDKQKLTLGITQDGDDFTEQVILNAVEALGARAAGATAIIDAERAEVLRLATIVESDKDGKLSDVVKDMLAKADPAQLPGLKQMYGEKAEAKFAKTCQDCGSTNVASRSSVEAPPVATSQAVAFPEIATLL